MCGWVGGGGGAVQGLGGGWSYRDGQRAPGWGLSGVGPVRVGRTALWKHGRETSWCIRLGRRRASGGGGRPTCVPVLLLRPKIKAGSHQEVFNVLLVNAALPAKRQTAQTSTLCLATCQTVRCNDPS